MLQKLIFQSRYTRRVIARSLFSSRRGLAVRKIETDSGMGRSSRGTGIVRGPNVVPVLAMPRRRNAPGRYNFLRHGSRTSYPPIARRRGTRPSLLGRGGGSRTVKGHEHDSQRNPDESVGSESRSLSAHQVLTR